MASSEQAPKQEADIANTIGAYTQHPARIPPTPPRIHLLSGLTGIVTGGTTGIGRAIALAYIAHGANVVVNHLPAADPGPPPSAPSGSAPTTNLPHASGYLGPAPSAFLDSLLSEALSLKASDPSGLCGSLFHLPGDVRDPATATALVAFATSTPAISPSGRLDICVSNAGVCKFADFLDAPSELAASTIDTNLTGAYYVVQAAARHMARVNDPPGGSVIGISSISGLVGGAGQVHYTPTKAGVLSLMQSAACALGKYGIRCNALLPGTVQTRLNEGDLADSETEGEEDDEGILETKTKVRVRRKGRKRTYMEGRIPLGRIGKPEDVAGPAVFLACEELSSYVTGAQLLVDGGLFVNLQ